MGLAMTCQDCGTLTINGPRCYQCEVKAKVLRDSRLLRGDSPTVREMPGPKYAHPEVVAWLTERCPSRVNDYSGHLEMEMPKSGVAFVELVAAAIEHGRSLGPRAVEVAEGPERERFGMLEIED